MSANKKVVNTKQEKVGEIQFKSRLEAMMYKILIESGFKPLYEPKKFVIMEGFSPTVLFYDRNKSKQLINNSKKVMDITYTPDFIFQYNNINYIVEAKGFENDVFPVKKKLFRKWLEEHQEDYPSIYCEVYTKKQLLEIIKKIKNE